MIAALPNSGTGVSARAPLSDKAALLLRRLIEGGNHSPETAVKDSDLCVFVRCPARSVIDLAFELIAAGWLVCATCSEPFGRFLVRQCDPIRPARDYDHSLGRRAVKIWRRRKLLRAAIAKHELGHSPDSTGQLALFAEGGA